MAFKEDAAKFYAIRTGAAPKEWYFKKAPQFGPPVYEKLSPYCKWGWRRGRYHIILLGLL